jgi:L-iditol 2-dehydrogenase
MKAAIYPGNGADLVIDDRPDPEPGPNDLIIKVHRCGICGTDLHMTEGHAFQFPAGSTPGHEFAGEIVAIGREVSGWRAGDRLTALPSLGCGQLDFVPQQAGRHGRLC